MGMTNKKAQINRYINGQLVTKTYSLSQCEDGVWQCMGTSGYGTSYINNLDQYGDYWTLRTQPYGFRATSIPYYLNKELTFNLGDLLLKLSGYNNKDALATILEQMINTKVDNWESGVVFDHSMELFGRSRDGVIAVEGANYILPSISGVINVNAPYPDQIEEHNVTIIVGCGVIRARSYDGTQFGSFQNILGSSLETAAFTGKYYAKNMRTGIKAALMEFLTKFNVSVSVPIHYGTFDPLQFDPTEIELIQETRNAALIFEFRNCTALVPALAPHVIMPIGGVFVATINDTGEDIEPTDPWEEPDPYDPIPPGPVPPGPVDPVDPVDPVPEPDYPPIDGASVGIYKVYRPDSSQLRDIAAKLWDPNAWDAIKQMFANPMESLLGLAIVPVTPLLTSPEPVYLGRYNTQVSVPRVSSEYVTVDCGSLAIKKFYGSYLDHDPYTKYTLYLPYIGELDINADEITGKTVHIKYHCNVVTGDCVAIVLIDGRACYTAMGNIIRQLPLSQTDFSSVIQTAVSAAATMLQTAQSYSNGIQNAAAGVAAENPSQALHGSMQASTAAINGVASTLNNVASTKLGYKHAGKIGQGAAQMSVQKPFFTVSRPNLSLPEGIDGARNSSQKRYTGYPANYIDLLSNFHGFTIVEESQLNMLGATDAEIAEATAVLKGGVIL